MKLDNIFKKTTFKLYSVIQNIRSNKIISNNKKYYNEILEYIELFNSKTSFKKSPELKWRLSHLVDIFNKNNLKTVVEIGTGRTTLLFNFYKKIKKINQCNSIEQNLDFSIFMNNFFKEIDLECNIINSKYVSNKLGGYLEHELSNCDLLYIDGPEDENKFNRREPYNTYSGKASFSDALNYLNKGFFPKFIIFDGRIDSVDLILNSTFSKNYKFRGGFRWAINHFNLFHLIQFNRHSSFELKK